MERSTVSRILYTKFSIISVLVMKSFDSAYKLDQNKPLHLNDDSVAVVLSYHRPLNHITLNVHFTQIVFGFVHDQIYCYIIWIAFQYVIGFNLFQTLLYISASTQKRRQLLSLLYFEVMTIFSKSIFTNIFFGKM